MRSDIDAGASAYRAHVDFELYSVRGLSFSYDSMEGSLDSMNDMACANEV